MRDLVREMEVELVWVDTESNPSDLLTKAITSKAKFDRFAKVIAAFGSAAAQCVHLQHAQEQVAV